MKKINRRKLLKAAGLGTSGILNRPLEMMFGSLLMGIINKAHAQNNTNDLTKNFIMFALPGAPSRWTWEPLVPHDDKNLIIPNFNVVNRFSPTPSDTISSALYDDIKIRDINMPWLWQFDLPTISGSIPMSSLMSDMLMIKGINVVNPGHTGARLLQFKPSGISHTMSSLTSDLSERPIPFIGSRVGSDAFASKLNKSGIFLGTNGNWLENLLTPFKVNSSSDILEANLSASDNELKAIFESMDKFARRLHPGFDLSKKSQKNALEMISQNLNNLESEFFSRRDKYRSLLEIATDPIPNANPLTLLKGINDKKILVEGVEIRELLKRNQRRNNNFFGINFMAEQFALIEYALIHKLTASITANLVSFNGFSFDEHNVHPHRALLSNSLWNRGFATCVNELRSKLKEVNEWDKTLIMVAGEFGRTPKKEELGGSDHAVRATCATFFGGDLTGDEIIGDTLQDSKSTTYPGSWSMGADNDGYGIIGHGHLASTIAELLKAKSPVTNASSLVKIQEGKYVSKMRKSKLIINS